MMFKIKKNWEERPLVVIIVMALFVRLIAVLFSKGFGMYDDHFVIIETAQNWVNGIPTWFVHGQKAHRNLLYPGLHYILFYFLDNVAGLTDPQFKMYVVRFFHALFSVLIVVFGYKITLKISNVENAKSVGVIFALFWPFPFFGVRNMVEIVCIPPILIGFYLLLQTDKLRKININDIVAGVMMALSVAIRYQTGLFALGIGLVLMQKRKWSKLFLFSAGFVFTIMITSGFVDYIAWGTPFFTIKNYVIFNVEHRFNYITLPWYNYILLIIGIFIPPTSFFFIVGYFRMWKTHTLLFLPTLIFIAFHSYFPNKQERFILPAIPLLIILGIIGWNDYVKKSEFWNKRIKLQKIMWGWFWVLNISLMTILLFTYSKKNRVETLYYLSKKNDVNAVIWSSYRKKPVKPPKFYLNKKVPIFVLSKKKTLQKLKTEIDNKNAGFPNYIIFIGENKLRMRKENFERTFAKRLTLDKKVTPSFIDDILYKLNPENNINQTSFVYKIK